MLKARTWMRLPMAWVWLVESPWLRRHLQGSGQWPTSVLFPWWIGFILFWWEKSFLPKRGDKNLYLQNNCFIFYAIFWRYFIINAGVIITTFIWKNQTQLQMTRQASVYEALTLHRAYVCVHALLCLALFIHRMVACQVLCPCGIQCMFKKDIGR